MTRARKGGSPLPPRATSPHPCAAPSRSQVPEWAWSSASLTTGGRGALAGVAEGARGAEEDGWEMEKENKFINELAYVRLFNITWREESYQVLKAILLLSDGVGALCI